MITVSCPNCEATYQLDESKLADGGRKLKCAQCRTVWIAKAETPAAEAVATPAPAAEPAAPASESEAAAEAKPEAGAPEAGPDDLPPPPEDVIERTPGVEALVRVGGWRNWVRGDNIWRTGALVLIGMGVLAGAGVFFLKMKSTGPAEVPEVHEEDHGVAEEAPGTALVEPPKGVVLHRVHGEVSPIDGTHGGVALTVRGLLTNTTSASVVVPSLRLELLGDDGKVADMWPVSNVSGTMGPLAEQEWSVSLSAPDMSAVKGWRVVFVGDKAGAAPVAPQPAAAH